MYALGPVGPCARTEEELPCMAVFSLVMILLAEKPVDRVHSRFWGPPSCLHVGLRTQGLCTHGLRAHGLRA